MNDIVIYAPLNEARLDPDNLPFRFKSNERVLTYRYNDFIYFTTRYSGIAAPHHYTDYLGIHDIHQAAIPENSITL